MVGIGCVVVAYFLCPFIGFNVVGSTGREDNIVEGGVIRIVAVGAAVGATVGVLVGALVGAVVSAAVGVVDCVDAVANTHVPHSTHTSVARIPP